MELRRSIYQDIKNWKEKGGKRKALVIEGLRQIGKSFIVEKFARENYENVFFFDFRKNASHRAAFEGDFDLPAFKSAINMVFHRPFTDENAALVFDEIGDCPSARAAIKYILKETRFDIIATGSLLGVKGFSSRNGRSPSVGSETFLTMHPLDFEEFLWANDVPQDAIDAVGRSVSTLQEIDPYLHDSLVRLTKAYVLTGGMPEAVLTYLATKDFNKVFQTNAAILKEMEGDFGRIINENGQPAIDDKLLMRTREVFDSLPSQLAKENTKFQFSSIRKGGRAKDYELAIQWLIDSGLVVSCINSPTAKSPLALNGIQDNFKLYFADIGLLMAKSGIETMSSFLRAEMGYAGGYVYENLAADMLNKENVPLYFSNNGESELDFLVETTGGLAIVEVKKGNSQSKAARAAVEGIGKRQVSLCYKVRDANFGMGSYFSGIPHCGLPFLAKMIREELEASLKEGDQL